MNHPQKCTCDTHAMEDYSKYSRDPKLLRRGRRDSLDNARRWRLRAETEPDPKERAWLEAISICAEWKAWIYLLILREIKTEKPMEVIG